MRKAASAWNSTKTIHRAVSVGPVTMARHDDSSVDRGPRALLAALWVTLTEIAVVIALGAICWALADNASAGSDDPWAGTEYIYFLFIAAPLAAMITGPIVAAKLRLREHGLYFLTPLLTVILVLVFRQFFFTSGLPLPMALAALNFGLAALAGRSAATEAA